MSSNSLATGVERENAVQKSFRFFWWFLVQWETFLDRILAFDASGGKCSSGRVVNSKFFIAPVRDRALARNFINSFQTTQQWKRTARAPLRPL